MPCVSTIPAVVDICSNSQTEIGAPTLVTRRLGALSYVHGIEQMKYISNHSYKFSNYTLSITHKISLPTQLQIVTLTSSRGSQASEVKLSLKSIM